VTGVTHFSEQVKLLNAALGHIIERLLVIQGLAWELIQGFQFASDVLSG
jgi:hypothetical protein